MKSSSAEFGIYNELSYRVCYGLTKDGKMDYSTPHYEFIKYCKCEACARRLRYDREPPNTLTITTDDKHKFPEIEKIIKDYTCDNSNYIGRKYILMKSGNVEEKICI